MPKIQLCTVKGCPNYGKYCRMLHGLQNEKEETQEAAPMLLKRVQAKVNLYVRLRDKGKPCISCGCAKTEDAGHYKAQGSYSGVRYDLDNIHGQCHAKCNCGKYGNPEAYREGLIKRIGLKKVEALETRAQETKNYKWGRAELEALEAQMDKLIAGLKGKAKLSSLKKGTKKEAA